MNLKAIHRNYERLTMLERLSLADQAVARNDESEVKAIVAASPRVTFREPDYLELFNRINTFRLCNLATRFSYLMQFDFYLRLVDEEDEGLSNDEARLAAYLYVRATDSWRAVADKFGLCPDFSEQICRHLFSVKLLEMRDSFLREIAFTEDEARACVEKNAGGRLQTLADEIRATQEALGLLQS